MEMKLFGRKNEVEFVRLKYEIQELQIRVLNLESNTKIYSLTEFENDLWGGKMPKSFPVANVVRSILQHLKMELVTIAARSESCELKEKGK